MSTSATTNLTAQDYFSTTLSAGITSSTTTIPLNSVPSGTEGFLVIDPDNSSKEIIFYNAKGSSDVTVPTTGDRGRGGTSAVAHSSGATVKMMVNSDYVKEIQNGHAISALSTSTTAISNPYKFSVYRNAAQNATNGGTAQINYDTELYDTNSNFDSTTNYRYTAPVSGFYWFNARVGITVSTRALLSFYKNGSEVYRGVDIATGASGINVTATALLQLTASDYIDVRVYTDATNVAMTTGSVLNCFHGFLVSRT